MQYQPQMKYQVDRQVETEVTSQFQKACNQAKRSRKNQLDMAHANHADPRTYEFYLKHAEKVNMGHCKSFKNSRDAIENYEARSR